MILYTNFNFTYNIVLASNQKGLSSASLPFSFFYLLGSNHGEQRIKTWVYFQYDTVQTAVLLDYMERANNISFQHIYMVVVKLQQVMSGDVSDYKHVNKFWFHWKS
jgi:hypothetical protein